MNYFNLTTFKAFRLSLTFKDPFENFKLQRKIGLVFVDAKAAL